MKKLLLLLFLLPTFKVIAQRIMSDKIDKFTGTQHIKTTKEAIVTELGVVPLSVAGEISIDKEGDRLISLIFWFVPRTTSSLKENSMITFHFENGENKEVPYNGSYQLFSAHSLAYFPITLEEEDLELLSKDIITDIRINYNDYSIKKKNRDKIPNICKLLIGIIKYNTKQP